ncbi:MAG: hypothetical protein HeimC3_10160 [Candidatus Heimdallarchaeota archaeon LC_3]|nr:MAG: hypothetical protein HeimC3_10160 [Candidatus Heimdallarchaeota archaeon LC_3]
MASEEKTKAKFDLSDGIQAEDFIALGSGLLLFIWRILAIVFYPFIYIWRNLGRLRMFLITKSARPLTKEEIKFISSWPLFLTIIGIMLGIIFGLFGFLVAQDEVLLQLQDISNFLSFIGGIIVGIIDVITIILGAIWDLLVSLKDFVLDVFSSDFLMSFIFVAIIGFIGAIVILLILESRILERIIEGLKSVFENIFALPRKSYDYLDKVVWNSIVQKLGRPIVGGEKIENYSNVFYKRLIMATFIFSLLFFVISLYALFFIQYKDLSGVLSDNTTLVSTLSVIILVLILTGIFTGFPVTFFYMWLLSKLSGEKYSLKSVISSATEGKVKITPKHSISSKEAEVKEATKPILSAKERAEARRKRRKK